MRDALQPLIDDPDVTVPEQPPDMIGEYPMFVLYPQPGTWTPQNHMGTSRRAVINGLHEVVIEWHIPFQSVPLQQVVAATTPMADAIADTLWSAFATGRFSGTVTGMTALRCETYGELGWGSDPTFGVRMIADIQIAFEVSS